MSDGTLELIDLDIPKRGYTKFISSWLYHGTTGNFLVDVGPSCTVPILLDTLDRLKIKKLDWILLTHIHQDHAGGLGELIEHFPDAKVVCHEKGVKHLISPEKLWEGSKSILGKVARIYGPILPTPKNNFHVLEEIPFGSGIKVIPTPGHASHHQCYIFEDWFFAGELFGAFVPMDSGLYLRLATPQQFILEKYLRSLDLVQSLLTKTICFAHYGSSKDSSLVINTAREQLKLWVKIIEKFKDSTDLAGIIEVLLENDKIYSRFYDLDKESQQREREFSINSIRGMINYLETK